MFKRIAKLLKKISPLDSEKELTERIEFALALEQTLTSLEAGIHESDDLEQILERTMQCACKFYQGDWIGFLEVDLDLALWSPTA